MAVNVSESKEQMSYGKAKGIATWYLNHAKGKGEREERLALDLTPEEAWEAKVAEDKQKAAEKKAEREKKRKERGETDGGEGPEPEQKKPRSKNLQTSAEEKANWEERKKAESEDGEKEKVGSRSISEEEAEKAVRSMSLRLYPSEALEKGLLGWMAIADAMDSHVKEVVETFAGTGEKISFEYARNEAELERRKKYVGMPYDVQQATIKESVGGTKSAQINYERGHNKGYEVREREGSRRWKTLNFLASGMSVDSKSGEVTMYPNSDFVPKDEDRGIYLKDRIIRFLCPEVEVEKAGRKQKMRLPTKMWGQHLQCGKKNGGQGFKIRYDSLQRKWYLILSYDAKVRGAPFQFRVLDKVLSQTEPVAN
ncbi:hypothetical protein HDV00_009105 [Rhizophlyctis rosea]|nr:hypothetical protein HDV00_009105 [Rhizophlyctis rosea]